MGKTNPEQKEKNLLYKYKRREEDPSFKDIEYFYAMKHKFGVPKEEIIALYDSTQGYCQICGKHYSESKGSLKRLCIDYSEKSKKIRGLLCRKCKIGIDMFQDNPELLNRVVNYLKDECLNQSVSKT